MAKKKTITITQTRSQIGRSKRQRDTLKALGLSRPGKSVELKATEPVLGMIESVKHLIKVEK